VSWPDGSYTGASPGAGPSLSKHSLSKHRVSRPSIGWQGAVLRRVCLSWLSWSRTEAPFP